MIIKKIKLENIRSYLNEEIEFPEGSVLLSGDVGSGKSSILLAVDFALFGLTRGILSGNALLRNGRKEGSVELYLDINGKNIVIKRGLKRSEDSVNQDSGYIIIDGIKEDGSAVELKAKVLELLNYPKDLLTKSKSLIYRFTVYTPQEEMKRILVEDAEERLEILRRVFDIDKYKRIRENCTIIIRKLKERIKEGELLSSGLEEKKVERSQLEKEVNEKNALTNEILKEINIKKNKIDSIKNSLEDFEDKIKKLNEDKNRLILVNNNIEHKTKDKERLEEEIEELNDKIKEGKELLKSFSEDFENDVLDKINLIQEEIREKKDKLNKIVSKKSEFKVTIRNSEELINQIKNLDKCPMCFQDVTIEHKHKINSVETDKLKTAEKNIIIFNENEEGLEKKIAKLEDNLNSLREKLNDYKIMKVKVEGLEDKGNLRDKCKEELGRILESFGALHERKNNLEFKIDENKNIEKEFKENKKNLEELQNKFRELEIKKISFEERLKNINETIQRLDNEIVEKVKVKERKEKLNSLVKWLNEQFLEMTEKMERSVMLRLHNDFNSLFEKWVNILIDNENLNVKLDNEFTPMIVQDGYDIEYGFLSGGEKTAIALAYRLSLNQVINNLMSLIETKDVIILDEPTDGFSNEQLDRVRVVLDELNIKQVIIVSHEDKIESFVDNVLRFEKKGHVSNVLR